MNMLPWYKIKMCGLDVRCDNDLYSHVVIVMGETMQRGQLICSSIGMHIGLGITPYPGTLPDYALGSSNEK